MDTNFIDVDDPESRSENDEKAVRTGDLVYFDNTAAECTIFGDGVQNKCIGMPKTMENELKTNFMGAIFKIQPKFEYSAKKDYNKYTSRADTDPKEEARLRRLVELEQERNLEEERELQGKVVFYGQIIQLVHFSTNTLLRVNKKEPAELDGSALKVSLQREGGKDCWFKIMSPFKIRNEGERVRRGDRIVLINEKTGEFIHLSNGAFSNGTREVNCFNAHTGWRINHYAPYVPKSERYLKGGDVVRLFHQEAEAFLKADLSPLFEQPENEIYLKLKGKSKGRLDSNSSNTLFQVELSSATKGGLIPWETEVRFRHMGTGKFLAIQEKSREGEELLLKLTSNPKEYALFQCVPVDEGPKFASYGTFFRIKTEIEQNGKKIEKFLHMGSAISDPNQKEKGLKFKYRRNKLMQVKLGKFRYEEVYSFRSVPQERVDDLNFVNGLYAVLESFVDKLKNAKDTASYPLEMEVTPIKSVLERCIRLCNYSEESDVLKADGIPQSKFQILLYEQQFVEKTIEILQYLFGNTADKWKKEGTKIKESFEENLHKAEYAHFHQLCTYVYKFLQVIVKKNLKIGNHVVKWLPFFLLQMKTTSTVRMMLIELFKDNFDLLNNIPEEHIIAFVQLLLYSGKDPKLLEFLQQICTCDGIPILRNQNIILQQIEKHFELVIETRFDKTSKVCEVNVGDLKKEEWINIEKFIQGSRPDRALTESKSSSEYQYAYNENYGQLIEYFKQMLRLFYKLAIGGNEIAIAIIKEKGIPSLKKEPLLSADEVLYCLKNEILPGSLRAIYCDLLYLWVDTDLPPNSSLTSVKYTWSWDELNPNYKLATQLTKSMNDNMYKWLFQNEGELKDFLVEYVAGNKFMITADRETSSLTLSALNLLEKMVRFGFFTNVSDQNRLLSPLISMLDGRNDKPSDIPIRYEMNESSMLTMQSKLAISKILHLLYDLRLEKKTADQLLKFKNSVEHEEDQATSKKKKKKGTHNDIELVTIDSEPTFNIDDQSFIDILLDLTFYEYAPLVTSTMSLLFRHMKPHNELCSTLERVQLLVDSESVEVYNTITRKMATLLDLMKDNDVSSEEMPELVDIVKTFIKLCCVRGDLTKPNLKNQTILRNMGVHEEVLRILRMPYKKAYHYLFKMCYLFLKQYCSGNKKNQIEIFAHMEFFLGHMGIKTNVSDTLLDLINDNYTVVSQIDSFFIQHMIKLLSSKGRKRKYLELLSKTVEAEGHTIKNNQNLVITSIVSKREQIMLFWDQMKRKKRKALIDAADRKNIEEENKPSLKSLERAQSKFFRAPKITLEKFEELENSKIRDDDEEDLLYHVTMIELMARCCMGYNHVPEIMCQSLVPLSLCYEILSDRDADPMVKAAYAKFMNEVWFFTERSMDVRKDENMWRLLNSFAEDLQWYFDNYKLITDPFIDGYVFDGIFLLLKTFFSNEFNRKKFSQDQIAICDKILNVLTKMVESFKDDVHKLPIIAVIVEKIKDSKMFSVDTTEKVEEIIHQAKNRVGTLSSESVKLMKNELVKEKAIVSSLKEYTRKLSSFPSSGSLTIRQSEFEKIVKIFSDSLFSKTEYTKKLVAQLEESDNANENKQLRIDCLLIVISMINLSYQETDEVSLSNSRRKMMIKNRENVQNKLAELGVLDAAMLLLESSDEKVSLTALKLSCALFAGGNKHIQKKMMDFFLDSSDPHFFEDIHKRILYNIRTLKQQRSRNQLMEKRSTLPLNASIREDQMGSILGEETDFEEETDDGQTLLLFLQNLCEGHFVDMKHYLREQHDNTKSFNLVKETCSFVSEVAKSISDNLELANQLFRTLTEFSSGCPENQVTIMESKITSPINSILSKHPECEDQDIIAVKISIFELLNSMVEGQYPEKDSAANSNPMKMLSTLDFNAIEKNIDAAWKHAVEMKEKQKGNPLNPLNLPLNPLTLLKGQGEIDDGSQAMHLVSEIAILLKVLAEFDKRGELRKMIAHSDDDDDGWTQFVSKSIGSIEIVNSEGGLERIYFQIPDICHNLKAETKQKLMRNVKRDSPTEKLEDFVERSTVLTEEIKHQTAILENKYFAWVSRFSNIWRNILLVVTLLINILMIVFYQEDRDEEYPVIEDDAVRLILRILSVIHVFFSACMVGSFLWNWAPIIIYKKQRIHAENLRKQNLILKKQGKEEKINPLNFSLFLYARFLLSDIWFVYHCLYLIFSFVGAFSFPFFGVHLLDMSLRNPQVRNVLKAVTVNGKSILLTALLGVTIIYIYSIAGFWFLRESYDVEDGLDCDTLYKCLLTTFNYGIRSGGGIGDVMPPLNFGDPNYLGRLLFDVTFFLIIIIILLNIVFGIILDTFGDLRDQRNAIDEDIRTRCFICSLQSDIFNRQSLGFEHHIKHEHNMWRYLYYFIYLDQKDKDEFTSAEQYVYNMKDSGNIGYFPVNRSISLANTEFGPNAKPSSEQIAE